MLFRGLLVAASGFLFIFSPAAPMRLLSGPRRVNQRGLLLWGIIIWLITLIPALFFQSLVLQIAGEDTNSVEPSLSLTLAGSLLAGFFLQGTSFLVLRRRYKGRTGDLLPTDGLTLGFGIGLVAQVFTGLNLVGAGFRLVFGETQGETLQGLATSPMAALLASLAALILFRVALLTVKAALGVLVAQAVTGLKRLLLLAIALDALFAWLIVAVQVLYGSGNPGLVLAGDTDLPTASMAIIYYLIAATLAFLWLRRQPWLKALPANSRGRREARPKRRRRDRD